jgi:hypothetical protein
MPIFTLTLPERETCPASCKEWLRCYGNNMHYAERIIPDRDFEELLELELRALNARYPGGFVVRLHVLGDFYSVPYVQLWGRMLEQLPALRVFGYTARDRDHRDGIGAELWGLVLEHWSRFAMRFSGVDEPEFGAVTVERDESSPHIVCPAQKDPAGLRCCANCALCWHTARTIAFEQH